MALRDASAFPARRLSPSQIAEEAALYAELRYPSDLYDTVEKLAIKSCYQLVVATAAAAL
jgi:hypothetical protein